MSEEQEGKGLLQVLRQAFRGFNENDNDDYSISFESGNAVSSRMPIDNYGELPQTKLSGASVSPLGEYVLPQDRLSRYSIFQTMARTELVAACLQMHVAHALAPDMETGNIIEIVSDNPEFDELAKEVNADLGKMINRDVTSWAFLMATYGVHYIRPYGVQGKGITDIESSYYTLAKHVKEYHRGNLLSGFTAEYLKEKDGENVRLAAPWSLVAVKVPFHSPDLDAEPQSNSSQSYSLYTELHRRTPVETQDYGTSFLENSYDAWGCVIEGVQALRGSRYNASRIERFVTVAMEGLDPVTSANYTNRITTQFKKDEEAEARSHKKKGIIPTIWNKIIPVLSGGKGGVTVDTQTVPPDISGIEDVMFNFKRFCASIGVDPSMIGWSDLMQGGLGEGGWARTSIIAALRANWLRLGVRFAVERLIQLHLAYKYQRAFLDADFPFKVVFHSINTALAIEKADELQSKVDFSTAVATVLDMINQGSLKHSPTFKKLTMDKVGLTDEEIELILKELEAAPKDDEGGMFEGVGAASWDARINAVVNKRLEEIFTNE